MSYRKKVKLIFSVRRHQYFTVEPIHNGHLGDVTEQRGLCRDAETRVNVWTVSQKSGRCREVAVSGGLTPTLNGRL